MAIGLLAATCMGLGSWLWTRGKVPLPATELESMDEDYIEAVDQAIDTACASYPTAKRCRQIAACR